MNSELDGKAVFAVGDLLERHPTDPERYRVFGRKDDQIVLSTAENVSLPSFLYPSTFYLNTRLHFSPGEPRPDWYV